MNRIVIDRWVLNTDPDATRAAYSRIAMGSPKVCGCDPCLNFASRRQTTYPATFRQLLQQLGVEFSSEAEIYHNCRLDNGLHSYGGWFHFVGEIVSGADAFVPVNANCGKLDLHQFSDHFSAGVSARTALVNQAFDSELVLQLEFSVDIPWSIEARKPD